jgi:hypothetical protein
VGPLALQRRDGFSVRVVDLSSVLVAGSWARVDVALFGGRNEFLVALVSCHVIVRVVAVVRTSFLVERFRCLWCRFPPFSTCACFLVCM